jgi:hypothetical protein
MAELLGVPYSTVAVRRLPAILYYAALFIRPTSKRRRARSPRCLAPISFPSGACSGRLVLHGAVRCPDRRTVLAQPDPRRGVLYASGSLVACGLVRSYRGKRMRPTDVYEALIETGRSSLDI